MLRTMSRAARLTTTFAAAAALALPATLTAQDTRPVIVVYTFTNSSIGPSRAEFDGISTGVQDLLITDMASNAKVRLVDRSRIAEVLQEQNLIKAGQIDPQTAVRLAKIMGAQYAITGGFMSDASGKAVLTGRTIDVETTQIGNPEKIEGKSSDVMGMIQQLSQKLGANMTLTAKAGRRVGDAGEAQKSGPAQSGQPAATPAKSATVEQFAQVVSPKSRAVKLDAATLKLYSNGLDEMDKKNNAKAKQFFEQVVSKYPEFEPALNQLKKVS